MPYLVALAAVLGELVSVAACGPTPSEQQVLTNFFRASRVRDTTILASVASVTFEPRVDGSVQEFEITDFGAEQQLGAGTTISKQVTISAEVRTPDGQVVPRTFVVRMQRAAGERRWFITGFKRA